MSICAVFCACPYPHVVSQVSSSKELHYGGEARDEDEPLSRSRLRLCILVGNEGARTEYENEMLTRGKTIMKNHET